MENASIEQVLSDLGLPTYYRSYISQYFKPLAEHIDEQARFKAPFVLGINGCQGSGKSTAATVLQSLLASEYGHKVVVLSIDDFYLTKSQRLALAKDVNPLLSTRGVPGTHDVALALDILYKLSHLNNKESLAIPRFNKALDDRFSENDWDEVSGPVSVIIFEGWCIGTPSYPDHELSEPINELEEKEDEKGLWRQYFCKALSNEYQALFNCLNYLLMLKAPSFDVVYEWRLLQEKKLTESLKDGTTELMDEQKILRFIQHYQRLTEHCLNTIPAFADAVIDLDEEHKMTHLRMSSDE